MPEGNRASQRRDRENLLFFKTRMRSEEERSSRVNLESEEESQLGRAREDLRLDASSFFRLVSLPPKTCDPCHNNHPLLMTLISILYIFSQVQNLMQAGPPNCGQADNFDELGFLPPFLPPFSLPPLLLLPAFLLPSLLTPQPWLEPNAPNPEDDNVLRSQLRSKQRQLLPHLQQRRTLQLRARNLPLKNC